LPFSAPLLKVEVSLSCDMRSSGSSISYTLMRIGTSRLHPQPYSEPRRTTTVGIFLLLNNREQL
jgi:hypothetical protein